MSPQMLRAELFLMHLLSKEFICWLLFSEVNWQSSKAFSSCERSGNFDGQIYDAFSLLIELIQKAEQDIILIDGYVDVSTLNLLAKKQSGVSVSIYTFQKTKLTAQDIVVFNAQYPQLDVKYSNAFHDRFLILDGKTVYHIGASLKDAGKKSFAVMLMKNAAEALLEKLESI